MPKPMGEDLRRLLGLPLFSQAANIFYGDSLKAMFHSICQMRGKKREEGGKMAQDGGVL